METSTQLTKQSVNPITGDPIDNYIRQSPKSQVPQKVFESWPNHNAVNWGFIDTSVHERKHSNDEFDSHEMPKIRKGYPNIGRCKTATEMYSRRRTQMKQEATKYLLGHEFNGIHSSAIPSFEEAFTKSNKLWFESENSSGLPKMQEAKLDTQKNLPAKKRPMTHLSKRQLAKKPGEEDFWNIKEMPYRKVKRPFSTEQRHSEIYCEAVRNKEKGIAGQASIYWFDNIAYSVPLYSSFTRNRTFPGSHYFTWKGTSMQEPPQLKQGKSNLRKGSQSTIKCPYKPPQSVGQDDSQLPTPSEHSDVSRTIFQSIRKRPNQQNPEPPKQSGFFSPVRTSKTHGRRDTSPANIMLRAVGQKNSPVRYPTALR